MEKEKNDQLEAELLACLEDDASMRRITPIENIEDHLKQRFDDESVERSLKEKNLK